MKQKLSKKSVALTVTFAILVMALVFPAAATSLIARTINAQFGVNITINGLPFTPKDSNGKEVQAMVVDGTTYLPVRALGEAIGTTIKWDGETNTVKLYTSGSGDWISVDNTFYSMMNADRYTNRINEDKFNYTSDAEALKKNSGQPYQTGFIYSGDTVDDIWWVDNAGVSIAVDKQYSQIEFDLSVIYNEPLADVLSLVIKDNNGITYKTHEITAGNQKIEADIAGADYITIELEDANLLNYKEETRQITIGDMKLR